LEDRWAGGVVSFSWRRRFPFLASISLEDAVKRFAYRLLL